MSIVAHSQTVLNGLAADNYVAPYATAARFTARLERQESRVKLRRGLRRVTKVERCSNCGLPAPAGDVYLKDRGGVSHFAGLWLCGSVWVCPVCSAKIRYGRSKEVERAALHGLELGMGPLFGTWTIPHSAEDDLQLVMGLLAECRRWVLSQREVKELRRRLGYVGSVMALEMTHGENGWHPHVHTLEFFKQAVSFEDTMALRVLYFKYANRFYERRGWRDLSPIHGITLEAVEHSDALGKYLAKLQDGGQLHNEMARSDLKSGRAGSMMPFDILADFLNTGDCSMLDLWHEYERATLGKSAIRFTKGLRALLLPDDEEKTDEELASEEQGGVEVLRIEGRLFRKLSRVTDLEGKILTAYDTAGVQGVIKLLRGHGFYEGYYEIVRPPGEAVNSAGTS